MRIGNATRADNDVGENLFQFHIKNECKSAR